MSDLHTVALLINGRSSTVLVGHGARHALADHLPRSAARVAIVTEKSVPEDLIPEFGGLQRDIHEVPPGEDAKSLTNAGALCRSFARSGLTRADVVVGVGGGKVTDLAGFAASTYHRGLPVMHVATSLLAMVDAAIGGKTGVNLPEGKNLVGTFWQPIAVACDLDALATLPPAETRCGEGELAKYHFISREDLSSLDLAGRIARAAEIKGRIVEADEREGGTRALLNYGHTLAHALETLTSYRVAHGEAVALGLLFAAHLGEVTGRISPDRVEEHYRVVRGTYGLGVRMPAGVHVEDLVAEMQRDKKALGSLTFVLDSESGLEVVSGVPHGAVVEAYGVFAARNS